MIYNVNTSPRVGTFKYRHFWLKEISFIGWMGGQKSSNMGNIGWMRGIYPRPHRQYTQRERGGVWDNTIHRACSQVIQGFIVNQQDIFIHCFLLWLFQLPLSRWALLDLLLQLNRTWWEFISSPTKHSIIFQFMRRQEEASFCMSRSMVSGVLGGMSIVYCIKIIF